VGKVSTLLQVGRTFGVRDGMLRLDYELRRGSGLISRKMRSVEGWDYWQLGRVAPATSANEMLASRRGGQPKFFFLDAKNLAPAIRGAIGAEGERRVLTEANKILGGDLPYFGGPWFAAGFPPQWFRNPVTGQTVSPAQSWTQMRFASPVYGDLKFILEPSRFLFAYPLVRAYALTGDERFPQAFWRAIEDWVQQSPPMSGPLWICGQECSLRILAWTFALHGFIHSSATTRDRVALLVSMIAAHAWRVGQTLGYARSQRSNHLISEAVGLWTVGTLYPELEDSGLWRELGAELLHEAVVDHVTPEGASQQHSFNYQRMILHLLLWAVHLGEISGTPVDPEIRERTEAAYDFMRQWVDRASGRVPNYGSNDGSLTFPLAVGDYRDFRPLVQLGAAVLNRVELKSGPWDEAALWFGVKSHSENETSVPEDKRSNAMLFVDTGYFRLGDENSWALIRAGHYARRPFQADQLHVDLWWNGINLARDAGTYLYNGQSPWSNGLAGTAVHNTITIDSRDQMRRGGRFLWLDWAQASGRVGCYSDDGCATRFEGEHNGYRRLGITHRRTVDWLDGAGWVVVDDVQGTGVHNLRLHWLTPDLPYDVCQPQNVCESPFELAFALSKARIRWSFFASAEANAAIIRAGKEEQGMGNTNGAEKNFALLGWESPTYGELIPAVSLVYETRSLLPVRFATVVLTDERCRVEREDNDLLVVREECILYRASITPGVPIPGKQKSAAMSFSNA
jgi:hypothetical protein